MLIDEIGFLPSDEKKNMKTHRNECIKNKTKKNWIFRLVIIQLIQIICFVDCVEIIYDIGEIAANKHVNQSI